MDAIAIVLIVVLVVVVAAAIVALVSARRRTQLRERFGPEYERAVASDGNRKEAEAELRGRLEAHDKLEIRPLSDDERDSYDRRWRDVQGEFVDTPDTALADADALVERLMRDRGYPVDDFERQADLVSVDHPGVVVHYREAHRVFAAAKDGSVPTEDMRQALVSYRALFADLLDDRAADPTKEREGSR
jgi:hypothetical protein